MAHAPVPHMASNPGGESATRGGSAMGGAGGSPEAPRGPFSGASAMAGAAAESASGGAAAAALARPDPMQAAPAARTGRGAREPVDGAPLPASDSSAAQDPRNPRAAELRIWPSLRQFLTGRSVYPAATEMPASRREPSGKDPRDSRIMDAPAERPAVPTGATAPSDAALPPARTSVSGVALDPSADAPSLDNGPARRSSDAARDAIVSRAAWENDPLDGPSHAEAPTRARLGGEPPFPARPRGNYGRAVASGPRRHSIAAGESFATIALLYYGSDRYDRALWQYNRGRFPRPDQLVAGDLLVIPDKAALESAAGGYLPCERGRLRGLRVRPLRFRKRLRFRCRAHPPSR
jgi:hypothetical protein